MNKKFMGLYAKFIVKRRDGKHRKGQKHHGCEYFVLDLTHDPHALPAILAYADSCQTEYSALATDLRKKAARMVADAR